MNGEQPDAAPRLCGARPGQEPRRSSSRGRRQQHRRQARGGARDLKAEGNEIVGVGDQLDLAADLLVVKDPFAGHRIGSVRAALDHDELEAVVLALLQESIEIVEQGVFVGVRGAYS